MLGRLALLAGSILFSLGAMEIGLRLMNGWDGLLHWPNLVAQARTVSWATGSNSRAVHDPRLGFVGRPGYRSTEGDLTYDSRSLRITPAPDGVSLAEPPILVVGDSFAHGDEVRDDESWPSRLQGLVKRRVVNAAMSGYGIDQMVLRAEIVAPEVKPAAIILSFIADDVRRAEMKRVWGAQKPYFERVNGVLVERNVPVPPHPDPAATLDIWQRLFGWSVLVDRVIGALGWKYEWVLDYARMLPRHEGEKLACPLFKRLAAIGVPVLVVIEYDPYHWQDEKWRAETRHIDDAVLACASAAGLATLDLFPTIDEGVRKQGLWTIYRRAHPAPAGTELAAKRIAEELQARHIPETR
jgi:GDSL-like Lipase/Acylhydrolase family